MFSYLHEGCFFKQGFILDKSPLMRHTTSMNDPLPVNREEMARRGWDCLDVLLVTGDAYVDHPSFGTAVIGRLLEAEGYRVGILSQPDWRDADSFTVMGRPLLFAGVASGNMDSMVNHYTSLGRLRSDDAYTPGGVSGKRPDRALVKYANCLQRSMKGLPIILGGIEASLRRVSHYDFWSDSLKKSVLLDSKAALLVYGMGERQIIEAARRLASEKGFLAFGALPQRFTHRNTPIILAMCCCLHTRRFRKSRVS
jgi:uncharacterized radical SAM protein YgiQ